MPLSIHHWPDPAQPSGLAQLLHQAPPIPTALLLLLLLLATLLPQDLGTCSGHNLYPHLSFIEGTPTPPQALLHMLCCAVISV